MTVGVDSCPICFESFDEQRPPHAIQCGHIFCRPCLEATAKRCALCSAGFTDPIKLYLPLTLKASPSSPPQWVQLLLDEGSKLEQDGIHVIGKRKWTQSENLAGTIKDWLARSDKCSHVPIQDLALRLRRQQDIFTRRARDLKNAEELAELVKTRMTFEDKRCDTPVEEWLDVVDRAGPLPPDTLPRRPAARSHSFNA